MQLVWLLPALLMSLMFASRSGSTPIFLLSFAAVAIQLLVAWRKSINLTEAANQVEIIHGRVLLDGRVLPKSSKLWSRAARVAVHKHLSTIPDSVTDQKLLVQAQSRDLASSSSQTDFWLGVSRGQDFELDLDSCVHILIVGPTGSGKSQLLSLLLNSLFATRDPHRLRAILVDFKGSALLRTILKPERFEAIIDDLDVQQQPEFWQMLNDEIDSREREQRERHLDPSAEPTNSGSRASPRLVIVVDELSAVLKSGAKAIETLTSLATRGRSLGIHLVLANQGLGGVPRELMLNLRTRIALQTIDQVELVQLGGGSQKISAAQIGWRAARLIRNDREEVDFRFPLGDAASSASD